MKSEPKASPVARPVSDRFRLRWDIFQFVVLALSTMPHVTGVSWHEWIGVAIIPVLVVHLLANWDWIVGTTQRCFRRLPGEVRFNQVWNALLFVVMTLVILSGILISERVVRFFGITVKPDPFWHGLHDAGASLATPNADRFLAAS
jgi:hypothetical protein